ncbi:Exc2 family lipoprotein [Klebsiella pneumoniae]|nr:Exc2 family lipoprotein [Klebsiella pneumoniae]
MCPGNVTGCTSSKSSPERHAYAFVAHTLRFCRNQLHRQPPENYRLNLPTFTAMYVPADSRIKPLA